MFRKPHKVKSNTQLKSSEKKKLIFKVQCHFSLKSEDVQLLLPSRESVSAVKIIVSSQDIVSVYVCQEVPLFYEFEDQFHPSVFVLWKYPKLIPHITVHSGVVAHLANGADLMVPGIVSTQDNLKENNIPAGNVFYICTEENIAAVAVGINLIDSSDMIRLGNKGKAVRLYHIFGDELSKMCEFGYTEIPYLGDSIVDNSETFLAESVENITLSAAPDTVPLAEVDLESDMTMDELLLYCFIKGTKKSYSGISFPILTNIFYKNCMLNAIPRNMNLDLKKTKYKKLSAFLSELAEYKIICLEDTKGVQSISSIDLGHEIFKNFIDTYKEEIKKVESTANTMQILEKNILNSRMGAICSQKYRKGDALTDQEVCKIITEYVKSENLQDQNAKEFVNLNGPLCDVLQTKDLRISWKDLFESILKKMSKCYEIRTTNNVVLTGKGKLPPIELTTAVKTSNKKVTLVKNLALYGINLQEFSKECQHGVAASSTINTLPTSKSAVFQIQGNQKKFIGKLLQEKYFIPKKYIEGLEEQKSKKHK